MPEVRELSFFGTLGGDVSCILYLDCLSVASNYPLGCLTSSSLTGPRSERLQADGRSIDIVRAPDWSSQLDTTAIPWLNIGVAISIDDVI